MQIRLTGIKKGYGTQEVIPALDLVIQSGTFTTLLGSSGCGKTTLLRMIAGLETPDAGQIMFDDQVVFDAKAHINLPPEARGLGFVFQDFALWPHMTVFENVAYGLRARRDTKNLRDRVREALSAVHLMDFEDRYPHQLSGGQQQRVAFARATVIKPRCILFDEPLSALDAQLREQMRAELTQLVKRIHTTAVFVTHDQIEAMSMSDRIAVLNRGVIEQLDTPERIYRHPCTPYVARFIGHSNWLDGEHMFRPEAAALHPAQDAKPYIMDVVASQFVGTGYELTLQQASIRWRIMSPTASVPGDRLTVYVQPDRIHAFQAV